MPASENLVPLQFGASSTETVGNSLLFLSMCFSCCPKLPQPGSRAGLPAQTLAGGFQWGFQLLQAQSMVPVLPAFPQVRQELLQAPCSRGFSVAWARHQHSL